MKIKKTIIQQKKREILFDDMIAEQKKREILFDDMIADMESNKKRRRKTQHFTCFYITIFFQSA